MARQLNRAAARVRGERGARDYLIKPFDDHEILQRVARLVRKRASPEPSDPGPDGPDDVVVL